MRPKLKVWNGRGWCCHHRQDPRWQGVRPDSVTVYICATSRADARRVVEAYTGTNSLSDHEIKVYFSEAWGRAMDGVTPERGLWLQFERGTPPVKVWGDGDAPLPAAAS
ncbi:hypothetical protein [Cupriavidus sp. TMH.W2]|uniref:hypothetical protein n=1 Tax=Cupriavidus sp. TMH.W2 TaxID=3434465 RepID=UPI003D783349